MGGPPRGGPPFSGLTIPEMSCTGFIQSIGWNLGRACVLGIRRCFPLQGLKSRDKLPGNQHEFEAQHPCNFHESRNLRIDRGAFNFREVALSDSDFVSERTLTQAGAVPRRGECADDRMEFIG